MGMALGFDDAVGFDDGTPLGAALGFNVGGSVKLLVV